MKSSFLLYKEPADAPEGELMYKLCIFNPITNLCSASVNQLLIGSFLHQNQHIYLTN